MQKRIQYTGTFEEIISAGNLLAAWKEFIRGKRNAKDVQLFELRLMNNILSLHEDVRNRTYRHGPYEHFKRADPKLRDIHKASVRDRLVHHALHRNLYPFFARTFIADSFSCQLEKGTHRALNRFRDFTRRASFSHTKTCWVLKCDIRKFFANIDHCVLCSVLAGYIPDPDILALLRNIVGSFHSTQSKYWIPAFAGMTEKGLPLGILTSQLLVNIYMNEFDQFVKHKLKVKYYIRYADDFVLLSRDKAELERWLYLIQDFPRERLKLELHPDKVFIKTVVSGVDFLGWVHFPYHRVLRTATKRRMFSRVSEYNIFSYLGLCKHGNAFKLKGLLERIASQNETGNKRFQ